MTRLFRSRSCRLTQFNDPAPTHRPERESQHSDSGDEEEDEEEFGYESADCGDFENPISTPFINHGSREADQRRRRAHSNGHQFAVLDVLVAALRKSIVTCSVERDDVSPSQSPMDISSPTEVRHVTHVTFDRFDGFLGLPVELEPEVPRKPPSASVSVFGVSAKSMQCSYDDRGNSVPTILLMMQNQLYSEGGLKAEGIFRINAENSQEEYVRDQLNKGVVPCEIDVHCLAGLIKAWLRELPTGVLDCLTPEQVMHCNTEDDCTKLVALLPPMEAALLDWAINLMADVVQHEQHNKMNARNIAMVFAPNMTQMADPLTALIHAVQVMNFLKTLILKTIRERETLAAKSNMLSANPDSDTKGKPHSSNSNKEPGEQSGGTHGTTKPAPDSNNDSIFRSATLDRLESVNEESFWSFEKKGHGHKEVDSISDYSTAATCRTEDTENRYEGGYDNGDWLSLRRGVRRLCRHPVFQITKAAKKTKAIGIVNSREGDREAWA